ncbi:MAG: hypothetical protein AAFR87_04895 [Bacteroidota bacterium]
MLENLPSYIPVSFILTTVASLILFYWVQTKSGIHKRLRNNIIGGISLWLIAHALLGMNGFYHLHTQDIPPRFLVIFGPIILVIVYLFNSKKGKAYLDSLDLEAMTWLSIIRIPVEFVLYWLALSEVIPELMTFAGRNFDIIGGITAPFVAYFGIQKGKMNRNLLLLWNFLGLGLLLFIIVNALLSAPFPFQQFAFDQPNIAILYFPFVWLPAFVAPAVLFCHLVSIRQLLYAKDEVKTSLQTAEA